MGAPLQGLATPSQLANISQQPSIQDNLLKTTSSRIATTSFINAMQPFYFANNDSLRGRYITKIGFNVVTAPSVMSLIFKNVTESASITADDFTHDGIFCTITTQTTGWHEYDLTSPNVDIVYVSDNLTNGKVYIPPLGRIIGFGKNGELCNTGFLASIAPSNNPDMEFYNVDTGAYASNDTLAFELKETVETTDKGFYYGKNISFLGDSISTYAGWIPTGNAVWYDGTNCNVTNVNQTWWKRLMDTLGMNLCVNNSWSGSRVSGSDASAGCMARATSLHTDTINPDIIIVYMGINDFNGGVAIGSYDGTQAFPTDTSTFREAYAIMLSKILAQYKMAKLYVCTLPYCEQTGTAVFPESNSNAVLLSQWNNAIRSLADLFGVEVIELSKCGMTYQNINIFMGDWDYTNGKGLHPNANGQKLMANKVTQSLASPIKYSVL